jgi:hypothetical protein
MRAAGAGDDLAGYWRPFSRDPRPAAAGSPERPKVRRRTPASERARRPRVSRAALEDVQKVITRQKAYARYVACMSSDVVAAIVGGVAGVVTGGISSLLAPWASWGIEKRRDDRRRKTALIDEWRAGIADHVDSGDQPISFPRYPWYASLRTNMVPDKIAVLESVRTVHVARDDGGPSVEVRTVRGAIARIQRRWRIP